MPTFDVGYLKRESNRMRQALVWGFSVRFQCFIELSALIRAVERSEPTDDALAAFQTEARRLAQLVALSQPSLVGASRFAKTLLRDGHTNEVAGQWTFSSLSDDAWETLCRYPSDTGTKGVRFETPEGRAVIGWALVPSVFDDDAEDTEYKLVLPEGR